MNVTSILQEIIQIITGSLTGIAQAIGEALTTAVTSIMFTTAEGTITGLSTFGIVILIFAGLSLAFGLTRLVYQFVTSLGNRNK